MARTMRELFTEAVQNVRAAHTSLSNAVDQDEGDEAWEEMFSAVSDLAAYAEDLRDDFELAYTARERRLDELEAAR